MLSSLLYNSLKKIFVNFFHFEIESEQSKHPRQGLLGKIIFGKIDGISNEIVSSIIKQIKKNKIDIIFLDGSNLGYIATRVKKVYPNVKVICFFHNVESKFFLDSFQRAKSLRSLIVLWINYIAERKAVLRSDHLITLTKEDSKILKKIYGKSSSYSIPMAVHDELKSDYHEISIENSSKYLLFVGGLFYANLYGIKWFIKNVSPFIEFKTIIVGNGFEGFKNEFEKYKNVQVIGKVDDLGGWYHNAEYVIAPIFDGSGMKTKVAEAFMYGKKIIATSPALVGYDELPKNSYFRCDTRSEFIELISSFKLENSQKFSNALRDIYERYYSPEAFQKNLIRVFQDL